MKLAVILLGGVGGGSKVCALRDLNEGHEEQSMRGLIARNRTANPHSVDQVRYCSTSDRPTDASTPHCL